MDPGALRLLVLEAGAACCRRASLKYLFKVKVNGKVKGKINGKVNGNGNGTVDVLLDGWVDGSNRLAHP